jgi:hypothetical protein
VGGFRKPPVFLNSGDVREVEIEELGVLRNILSPTNLIQEVETLLTTHGKSVGAIGSQRCG